MKDLISRLGVIPITAIYNSTDILPLCDALTEAGLPMLEVLSRTPQAMDAVKLAAKERPDFAVGLGTVTTVEQARQARESGAKFVVLPGMAHKVVDYCVNHQMPVIPGVVTPTEIIEAMEYGLDVLKLFPTKQFGGPDIIRELSGPFADIKFVVTGGLEMSDLDEYLAIDSVLAVGGVWMCRPETVAAGRFDEIVEICRDTAEIVRRIKSA